MAHGRLIVQSMEAIFRMFDIDPSFPDAESWPRQKVLLKPKPLALKKQVAYGYTFPELKMEVDQYRVESFYDHATGRQIFGWRQVE